ncbi:MAG: hypothetical protein K6F61_01930 [Clostridiales bacterium]|nr:hypothetical protein [Clostridiales bacterium]
MRKILALALILAMLPAAALAGTPVHICEGDETAAVLAELIRGEAALWENEAEALDKAVEQPETLALVTQQALILGLQGYSDAEVKTDIRLLMPLCGDDLYLVCSEETADACGVRDLPSLISFLTEQPFELMIMRCYEEASVTDYAATEVFEAADFSSDVFADSADCEENLGTGAFVLVAYTEQALRLDDEGCVVLGALTAERTAEYPDLPCAGECGLPVCTGRVWGLYAAAEGDPSAFDREEIRKTMTEDRLAELHCRPVDEKDFLLEDVFRVYIRYMTEEGLFFYEQ